jgi:hypothetical protein
MNDYDACAKSTHAIADLTPGTLTIGHYNRSYGLFDFAVVATHKMHIETSKVVASKQLIEVIGERLYSVNPNLLMVHLSHSEGGEISKLAFGSMAPEQLEKIRSRLLIHTFASANPIPNRYGLEVGNKYSTKDYLTKPFGKKYKDSPEYNIQFVACQKKGWARFFPEHDFCGPTYQGALRDYFKKLNDNYGFYNPSN